MSKARQLADLGNQVDDGAITGSNMVVNGAMTVAQRGVSATGKNQRGYYACDRAQVYFSAIDQMVTTVSQDTDAPDGFDKSHKVLVTTAETSIESNELHCMLWYQIEGQDLQQLGYGNANAKPMTLSFWVKSNVTGTYTLSAYSYIGGANSVQAPTYTINTAGTWEYKTLTISGNTTRGIVDSNGSGIELYWNGLVGSQYTSGTQATSWSNYTTDNWAVGHTADFGLGVNDYWQITGVCLNVGDSAIDFPHESYGETLAKCQRYYYQEDTPSHFLRSFYAALTGDLYEDYPLPVVMRATPSWTAQVGADVHKITAVSISGRTAKSGYVRFTVDSTGQGYCSLGKVTADAEL